MKEQHLNNLIDKLKEYSCNYIKYEWKAFTPFPNLVLDVYKYVYTYYTDVDMLRITFDIKINYSVGGYKYRNICNFIYNLDKSKQIEYLALRNNKDINKFLKTIKVSRDYYEY